MSALKLRHGFVVFEHDGKEISLGAVEQNDDGAWCFWPCESTWPGSWSQCQLRWIADRLWDLTEAEFADGFAVMGEFVASADDPFAEAFDESHKAV